MSNGGDIELKVGLDINKASKDGRQLGNALNKALSSSDTKLKNYGIQLQKVNSQLDKQRSKLEDIGKQKIPTQAFESLSKQIENTLTELDKVNDKINSMRKSGADVQPSREYQQLLSDEKYMLEQLEPLYEKYQRWKKMGFSDASQASSPANSEMGQNYKQMQLMEQELKDIQTEMGQLEKSGKHMVPTTEFQQATQEGAKLEAQLDVLNSKSSQMQENGTAFIPGTSTEAYRDAAIAVSALETKQRSLIDRINGTKNYINSLSNAFRKLRSIGSSVLSRIGGLFKKLKSTIASTNNSHDKSFKKMLNTVLKYGFGIRSIFLLYRKLRAVMKEGLTSMAQQFTETRVQVDSLKNSWSGFKSSLVSAFQPIFSYVVPALVTLINYLTSAMNTVANFFAILTGQGWYYKAKKGNESVAKSIGGTGAAAADANEKLAEYDELLVIDQNNSGSGGSGGGGGGSSDAWNWEKTDASPSKFAELLKEAFKTWDFTEVGEYIGQKLTDALNSINWDKVYQTAKNFGKGLATFLNGLISPDLFGALGTTIANAITTALLFLNTFGTTLDWKDFGNSIAEGIKKFVEHSPLKLAVTTFNTWANGILTMLVTAVRNLLDSGTINKISDDIAEAIGALDLGGIAWKAGTLVSGLLNSLYIIVSNKDTWKNLGTKIGDGINGLFKSMNQIDPKTGLTGWGALAKDVSSLATGLLEMLIKAVETIDWGEVGKAIADFISNIDWGRVIIDLGKLALAIGKALVEAIKGLWTNGDLLTKIGVVIVGLIGFAKLTGLASKLGTAISTALSSAGTINLASAGLSKITLGLAGVVIAWEVGSEIGNSLGKKIAEWTGDEELAQYYDEYDSWTKWLPELAGAMEDGSFWDGFSDMAADAGKGFLSLFGIEFDDEDKEQLKEWGKSTYNEFWGGFNQAKMGAVEAGNNGSNYKNVWFEYDENGNPRYAYNSNKLHYHWQEQKGVNYEYDENGNVKYAYQNKNKYKDSNLATHQKLKLEIEAKYNNKEISLGSFERYMDFIDRAYSYAKKHNMKIETVMGGDIQDLNDLNEWLDGFSILNSNADGYHTSNYDIDVGGDVDNTDDINKLSDSMLGLNRNWKSKDSSMNIKSSAEGTEGRGVQAIQNLGQAFKQKLYDIWKNKDATFSIKTNTGSVQSDYNNANNIWQNKSVTFDVEFGENTNENSAGYKAYEKMWYDWQDAHANFDVAFSISGNTNLRDALNNMIGQLNDILKQNGIPTTVDKNKVMNKLDGKAASGGIVASASRLLVGEAGTEAIVPLERNLGWLNKMATMITDEMIATNRLPDITKGNVLPSSSQFLQATSTFSTPEKEDKAVGLLEQILGRMNTDTNSNMPPIVLQLNGRQVAQVVWDENHKMYKQTGNPRYAT